jgi:hypothetical protein
MNIIVHLQLCNISLWISHILHSLVYHTWDGDVTMLVASLSPPKHMLSPIPFCVGFVVVKWQKIGFSPSILVFCPSF